MVIKKYIAKTEEAATALAREELGKDVVIMNVKKNIPKGIAKLFRKESVEVTAAVDEVVPESTPKEMPDFSKLQEAMQGEAKPAPDSKAAKAEAARAALAEKNQVILEEEPEEEETSENNAIEQKLSDLQKLLEKQVMAEPEKKEEKEESKLTDKNKAYIRLIRSQMENNEVEETYIEQILEEIEGSLKKDTSLDNILSGVYQKIVLKIGRPRLIDLHAKKKKYVFFIGPTGVGKTTTIAKIASMLKLSGKVKVALVTSDTYRIAAVEQLKTYANILEVPFKVIYSPEELVSAISDFSESDYILIDTAGHAHTNESQKNGTKQFLSCVADEIDKQVYLVLSATTKYRDLKSVCETYAQFTDYSLIFTKLDETVALGNLYNIKLRTGADMSYITVGQDVPDDIEEFSPQNTVKQLLGGKG